MKITYLVQSDDCAPWQDQNDVIRLNWKWDEPNCIFFPGCTWDEGRNRLLEEARHYDPDYYVLMDDDVAADGPWSHFETFLQEYRPAIGVPWLCDYGRADTSLGAVYAFDAIVTAIHRDVVLDGLIVPYVSFAIDESWWYSQLILFHMCAILYPHQVIQCPNFKLRNSRTGRYPQRGSNWAKVEAWLFAEVFLDTPQVRALFKPHGMGTFDLMGFYNCNSDRYRLDPTVVRELLRPEWLLRRWREPL